MITLYIALIGTDPIEQMWVALINSFRSNIQNMEIPHSKIQQKLVEELPLVWETFWEEFFEKWWMCMLDQMQAVTKAKGWYSNY